MFFKNKIFALERKEYYSTSQYSQHLRQGLSLRSMHLCLCRMVLGRSSDGVNVEFQHTVRAEFMLPVSYCVL